VDAEIGEVLRDNLKRISKNRQCNGQKTKGQKRQITIYKTLLRKERLRYCIISMFHLFLGTDQCDFKLYALCHTNM
jgi:hypothetical protein